MSEILIRRATEADLPRIAAIWYEAATEGEASPPPLRGAPSLYLHELDTQELVVLERDDEVVAYAAVITRGAIAFLADLSWLLRIGPPVWVSGCSRRSYQRMVGCAARSLRVTPARCRCTPELVCGPVGRMFICTLKLPNSDQCQRWRSIRSKPMLTTQTGSAGTPKSAADHAPRTALTGYGGGAACRSGLREQVAWSGTGWRSD
jgi:hypothetical protein